MTRAEIRTLIKSELSEAGISSGQYNDDEINDSIQDAYNDIAAKAYCIIKNATQNWLDNITYYDFISLGITDYMGCIGIFNNNTKWWLRDDIQLRDFDRLRRDWETWNGQAQFWAGHSLRYVAVAPKLLDAVGDFVLVYWASAPTLADGDTPLIATDMQNLIEYYCMADLLDNAEEPSKAKVWWEQYFANLQKYKTRCKNLAKADLLLRV